ncbi:MAG TPA: hypothetical protein VFB66_32265, partial [Tepidisphaeraceae bacterium]|nr:hypothetical protein [Tepidisphaeraceae bacterium]
RFQRNGSIAYRPEPGKPDLGATNGASDANGLTAASVVKVLEAATVSGDKDLRREGLRLLRALNRFGSRVPRGAQTWEVPLHTPDVLASAHLIRAYTLGYEMTGEPELLESARYWAWTGVPFVYLDAPVDKPVGAYATIPVFGATNWTDAWFGRPVQWCGLAYADALYRLIRHDPSGPWKQLADGITLCGIQQSWPASDSERQGLLPDFYHLRFQLRDGPAINPATLQSCAQRLFGGPPVYDAYHFRASGVWVHAPGGIVEPAEQDGRIQFRCDGWPGGPYHILISGLERRPEVRVNGEPVAGDAMDYVAAEGRLVLNVRGKPEVVLIKP